MSTTCCPRCSGPVTLPAGVSNSATVRCPLCHAQYSLADALVQTPPLLEVVEAANEADPDHWFDEMPADDAPRAAGTAELTDLRQPPQGDSLDEVQSAEDSTADQLEFAAEEASDDDLAVHQNDTEVEELSFSSSDSATPEAPREPEPVADAGQGDEGVSDSGEPDASEAETLALDAEQLGEAGDEVKFDVDPSLETSEGETGTLDVGEPQPGEAGGEVKFDLDEPQAIEATDAATIESNGGGDDIQFDLDASQQPDTTEQPGLGEFGDVQFDASGEAEDIPLDVPDEPAAAPVAAAGDEEPSGKKKEKKKKAKAAGGKPGRSLVGSLVRVALPAVIAVPFVFYLALWIGYDVVGLSAILPEFMVPAGSKGQLAQNQGTWTPPADTSAPAPFTEPDASSQASGEHTVARPALPGEEPPPQNEMPADEPPALGPDSTAPPADDAESDSAEKAGPGEPAADPFAPAVAPQDAPEPAADAPVDDDPFAQPQSPQSPPAEAEPADSPFAPDNAAEKMPQEGTDAAAEDDPFKRPSSPELPSTEPESPAGDADPFGTPATDGKPAPADDLFSPVPDAKGAEDEPAEPSAPTDAEALPFPDEPAQPVQPLGPRNFAQVTPAEVAGAMQATMTAGRQMAAAEEAGDAAQLNKARANFYVSLFDMANAITLGQLGPAGSQLDPRALEPMIREQLAADPKRFERLKIFGARWFAFPRRTTNGVVLAGTVESVDQIGKLFHTKVQSGPDAGATAVTVVSANDPQLEVGNEVMTFGSIVEEPADQLVGYEGSEPAVVWSGMTLKMSPPAH